MILITLTAGVQQIVDLGVEAAIVNVVNNGHGIIYAMNNKTASVGDSNALVLPAENATALSFGYDNCRYLHLISAKSADVGITVKSIFRAIHRGDLVAGIETVIDFGETASQYSVQNLSTSDTIYFSDTTATVDGSNTIELSSGVGVDNTGPVQKIHLISAGNARYQVIGKVR